jgi:hypothetical protein
MQGNVGKSRVALLFIGLQMVFSSAIASNMGLGRCFLSRDTLQFGDTLIITSMLINHDTVAYQGTVKLVYKLNGVENIDEKIFPNPLSGQFINLPVGDSLPVLIHIIITPAYFLPGPDILVVWPICPDGSNPYTKLDTTIYVENPTGFSDNSISPPALKVYTANSHVFVNNDNPAFMLNCVSIFDILGRNVKTAICKDDHLQIDMANEPDGIYPVEVTLSNGQRAVFKISKF